MKKVIVSLLVLSMMLFVACDNNNKKNTTPETDKSEVESIDVSVYGLNGPTSMGMIKMFEEDQLIDDYINVEYINVSQPDVVVGKLLKGEIDIAAVPTNVAAMIYNKTEGKYQVAAVNTLGVLYIMTGEGTEITSIDDLRGKTIHTSGKAATPEYVLNNILQKNGLVLDEDVFVVYHQTHQEVSTGLVSGTMDIVMLPQPFVTLASMGSEAKIALSLQDEWAAIEDADLAMGCIVVKTEFVEAYPDALEAFLRQYEISVNWVNENPVEASLLIEKYGVLPKAKAAEIAIPNSNIVFVTQDEMQLQMENILNILFDTNPKSIGGSLPNEGFYYKK